MPTSLSISPPAAFDAIIFDMDGVVINSEHLHEQTGMTVFREYGLDVPADIFDSFKGRTDKEVLKHVVATYASKPIELADMVARRREVYAGLIDQLEMIPGALSFIRQVAPRFKVALTTSASRQNQTIAFNKFDLWHFFEHIVTSTDIERPKPDPEPYQVTAERLGVAPSKCLVLEDSVNGIISAKKAGCTVVALPTTFEPPRLLDAGAADVADSYEVLEAWLLSASN